MRTKTLFLIFILSSLLGSVFAQSRRPRVAVVLSGGGAKGVAHIGALKVIEKAGIPVDIVTGTSMGSIIGGLYSCGWDAQRLDSMVRRQDWTFLLSDRDDYYTQNLGNREKQTTYAFSKTYTLSKASRLRDAGFIQGKNLMRLFYRLTAGYTDSMSFDSLPIPFACVATNIVDNTEYDFHAGSLALAMRTSMSIPAVFSPVRIGDKVLVDGGLRNNYPADIAKAMGADYIIGVTVQGAPRTADDINSSASVIGQIVDVNCKNKYEDNLALTDVAIRVNTKGYGAASFTPAAIDTLVRRGEEEAMSHWQELIALKHKLGLADDDRPVRPLLNPEALLPVSYAATSGERPENDRVQGSVGLRFDTETMVAMQLDGVYSMAKHPVDLEATLRLGKKTSVDLRGVFKPKHRVETGLEYYYEHNDLDVYEHGHKSYNLTLNHHQASVGLMDIGVRNLAMDLAVRWDYYNFHRLMVESTIGHAGFDVSDSHFFSYHANLHYNSENKGVFPTRGANFQAAYGYFTDNFYSFKGHRGFSELGAHWRMSFPLSRVFTLQPMLYGRLLFGSGIPLIRMNGIGGQWFDHYLDQQMPFPGIGHVEITDNHFVACQLRLQAQLSTNNFVLFKIAGAQHADAFRHLLKHGPLLGYELAYFYNTIIGPVGATLGYSNKTDRVNFMVNIGYEF